MIFGVSRTRERGLTRAVVTFTGGAGGLADCRLASSFTRLVRTNAKVVSIMNVDAVEARGWRRGAASKLCCTALNRSLVTTESESLHLGACRKWMDQAPGELP